MLPDRRILTRQFYKFQDMGFFGENQIIIDKSKNKWEVGDKLDSGGFGKVYGAKRVGEQTNKYVIKCEPFNNVTIQSEQKFYQKFGRETRLKSYMEKHNLSFLGVPPFISAGSATVRDKKYSFVVLPRYAKSLCDAGMTRGGYMPYSTRRRIALELINVLEYMHSCGYVHGDIKGANIMLAGHSRSNEHIYLVDYGLMKPLAKAVKTRQKMGSQIAGTLEFMSRDAHRAYNTRRSDIESLGYNLITWYGGVLPWHRLRQDDKEALYRKMNFMKNLKGSLQKCFRRCAVPEDMVKYFKFVKSMHFTTKPDYNALRQIFLDGDLIKHDKKMKAKKKATVRPKKKASEAEKKAIVMRPKKKAIMMRPKKKASPQKNSRKKIQRKLM